MHLRSSFKHWVVAGFVAGMLGAALSPAARGNTFVQFHVSGYNVDTYLGLELFDSEKPVTVGNFLRLVEANAYTNMFFHRLVPEFVIQGGGFFRSPSNTVENVPNFGTITNEFSVGPLRSNVAGTIAMAKVGGDADSATSQFFINLADNSGNLDHQNGGYTVFGRVIYDIGLIELWNTLGLGNGIINLGAPFDNLPVNYGGTENPTFENLIYCDVTVLKVVVTNTASGTARTIRWNRTVGLTNVLEAASSLSAPVWEPLMVTTGGLGAVEWLDAVSTNQVRIYRVRVVS